MEIHISKNIWVEKMTVMVGTNGHKGWEGKQGGILVFGGGNVNSLAI